MFSKNLETLKKWLSITTIVCSMQLQPVPSYTTTLVCNNFAKIAEAFGCGGIRVEKPGEIKDALKQAFSVTTTQGTFDKPKLLIAFNLCLPERVNNY